MKLAGINAGDIVEIDKGGRRFLARVAQPDDRPGAANGRLPIDPIHRGISWRQASAREVVAHWARRGRPRARS
ncbi:MAG: hypothetical protein H0U80_02755 [Solirubrobacterales bacterium]|nr:hypothetical protein [Solirubrobacterales bacterium]